MSTMETVDICLLNSSNCSSCSYGPHCQWTTIYVGLNSLQSFFCSFQSFPVALIIVGFLLGTVWNILAIGTFCQKPTREMGTAIYRLWLSIIGQLGLTVVLLYVILEESHSGFVSCYLLEYLRRVCHSLYDWLTACTACERTFLICQGLSFNKLGSRRVAKRIIPLLIAYHLLSVLYEPFYRQMIVSSDRSWCLLNLPNGFLQHYHRVTNLLHFLIPYLINLLLPLVWIVTLTKNKRKLYVNLSIWNLVKKVLWSYKYTIIGYYTLVSLNTPRLISILTLTCIQYKEENTFYQLSYFLSIIPMMISMFIFVLPSPKYRPQLIVFIHQILHYRLRRNYFVA